jgi:hypothetical protein
MSDRRSDRANGDDEETSPVEDLAFYNVGFEDARGLRRIMILARRLLRRVLRPIFFRQAELFQHLTNRLDEHEPVIRATHRNLDILAHRQELAEKKVETFLALGWDHVALARRLAVLEDQIAVLTGQSAAGADHVESKESIPFPGLEPRSKVS